jgi:hypothetical protein
MVFLLPAHADWNFFHQLPRIPLSLHPGLCSAVHYVDKELTEDAGDLKQQ